jgi:hypothetical protein
MKQTDSSIIIVRNVCMLTSTSMIVYLLVMRSWSAIIGTKQPKVNQSQQQWWGWFFFINWTLDMSDNLPERVQILGHVHILCITVREKRIICCQIFFDLLLKSAFERIFNVMQLILVKIKRHIKWKYLIQKFHDIWSLNFLIFFLAVCLNISVDTIHYREITQLKVLIIWCLYADFKHLGDQNHGEKSCDVAGEFIALSLLVGIC